jgi:hypothetical protein
LHGGSLGRQRWVDLPRLTLDVETQHALPQPHGAVLAACYFE